MMLIRQTCVLAAFGAFLVAPASAQRSDLDPGRAHSTRASLEELLAQFDAASRSGGYSEAMRDRARQEADLVRRRLVEGDFQVGDRVVLMVEGEPGLSGQFTVTNGRRLVLPQIGELSLEGVLRSEIEEHVRSHLSRFIRSPVVTAQTLVRVTVTGEVSTPGFLVVPAESLVTEVLMQAGGPTRDAKLSQIRIERDGRRILEGRVVEMAITEGRTLDQLSLRAGDRIDVPGGGGGIGRALLVWVPSVLTTVIAVVTVLR
jgi:hypothetical protein